MTFAFFFCLVCYCISLILSLVSASEEAVTINKPIMKTPKSWHFSTDYVRCFCNLPSCVTTGYMCKSSGGTCFSDVIDQSASVYRGHHGCLELLNEEDQQSKCQRRGINERTTIRRKENSKSLLICCHHDMCNHIESPPAKNLMNDSLLDDVTQVTETRYQQKETFLYSEADVWFRAATIAVPICGAVILFLLIALAVKILKSEHQNAAMHKLGPTMYVQPMNHHSKNVKEKCNHMGSGTTYDNLLGKEYIPTHHNTYYSQQSEDYRRQVELPLLLRKEQSPSVSFEKNTTNAKINLINNDVCSGKSIILEIEKDQPKCSEVNIINTNNPNLGNASKFCTQKTFIS
ncbi:uncharacterized protein [Leptinotarsa decemlineata]|uniref:uncharacterized protein n=1 Tax=Leptinotarsa decemlineata TaxID=7539 RepID=UPI003D30721D